MRTIWICVTELGDIAYRINVDTLSNISIWDVIAAYFVGQDQLLGTMAFAANRTAVTLQIVFLAGLSDAIGNSVILLANRIRPFRFALAILANAMLFLFGYLAWSLSLLLITNRVFGLAIDYPFFFSIVALSYIPILFSVFSFFPYFGYPINLLLYGISAIYLIRILVAATELTTTRAFFSTILGFVFLSIIRATIGRPVIHFGQWVVSTAAGRKLERNIETALNLQTGGQQ
jgi:hypothetical protein